MLVLSRKVGEKIILNDNVTIVVNRIAGHRVSIGIVAPRGMRIVRSELRRHDEIAQPVDEPGFSDPTGGAAAPTRAASETRAGSY